MSREEIEKNKINWRPWEHRKLKQSTPELTENEARIEYLKKELEGKKEMEEMIKLGLISIDDI